MANVTNFPPQTDENVGVLPEFEADPIEEKRPPVAKKRPGRPFKGDELPISQREPLFFDRVAAVRQEDWGTRAFMYVYADEPVMQKKTQGTTRYLFKSSAPITDLEGLKQDYGSFKGWMSLNLRKTGKDATDQVDRYDFEIYDPKHPPKFPREAWANDDRNKRWAALLPPEPPPVNQAASSLLDGARLYQDIRAEVRDDMKPDEAKAAQSPVSALTEAVKLMKELQPPAPPPTAQAAPADPFSIAKSIMDMRGNDPMVGALMQLLDSANKSAEAARQREFELMKEMRAKQEVAAAPPKGTLDSLLELATSAEKLEPLKKLFGGMFGSGAGEAIRPARTSALDLVRDLADSPFGAALGQGIGSVLQGLVMRGAAPQQHNAAAPVQQVLPPNQPARATAPNSAPVMPQTGETVEDRIRRIAGTITHPMLYEFFLKDLTGGSFAEQMYSMFPEDYEFVRGMGVQNIVTLYKGHPTAWPIIAPKEHVFVQFVQEFCEWSPAEEPGTESEDGIKDLEEENT